MSAPSQTPAPVPALLAVGPCPAAAPPPDLRVAMVDDEPAAHIAIKCLLKAHRKGWRFDSYLSATHALRDLPSAPPDIVLMDISMPGLSGIECACALKPALPKTRVVMFTARSDSRAILESLAAGASGYIIKPVASPDFIRALTNAAHDRPALCEQAQSLLLQSLYSAVTGLQEDELGPRERQVLFLMVAGLREKEIVRLVACDGAIG